MRTKPRKIGEMINGCQQRVREKKSFYYNMMRPWETETALCSAQTAPTVCLAPFSWTRALTFYIKRIVLKSLPPYPRLVGQPGSTMLPPLRLRSMVAQQVGRGQ
jgi:hypothetical protein